MSAFPRITSHTGFAWPEFCTNWFNFYPVGQGLFYAGVLSNGNYGFVYDCGTETKGVNIRNYISHLKSCMPKGTLDFVVISHLHKDHFSGLQDLRRSFAIQRIIAPYICEDVSIRKAIYASLLFLSLQEDEMPMLGQYIETVNYLASSSQDNEWHETEHGCFSCEANGPAWKFVFVTKAISGSKQDEFKNGYERLLARTGCKTLDDLIKKGLLQELSEVYKTIFGSGNKLNETSVVMLHHPILPHPTHCIVQTPSQPSYPTQVKYVAPTSLLTGDALIDKTMASVINSHVDDDIGIIQVPHHGSYNNWKAFKTLVKNGNSIYVIPCGTHNSHGHPSKKTLRDLNGFNYYLATEFSGYLYWISCLLTFGV